jgi:hypothetical protein
MVHGESPRPGLIRCWSGYTGMKHQAQPLTLPIAAPDALAWAEGRLHDKELLWRSPLVPEAVFVVDLPSTSAYRQMLRQVAYWARHGAVCMVARTSNDTIDDHFLKIGGIPTFREPYCGKDTEYRFFLPPAAFKRWVAGLAAGVLAFLLAACQTSRIQPTALPRPPKPAVAPILEAPTAPNVALPAVPQRHYALMWDYDPPPPCSNITFIIYHATGIASPSWTVFATTNQPPFPIGTALPCEFFRVTASNTWSHLESR